MAAAGVLYVFDFDHTIVDGNSDLVIMDPVGGYDQLPQNIKHIRRKEGSWTAMMNATFRYLHSHGVSVDQMKKKVAAMPLTPGMKDVLRSVHVQMTLNRKSKLVIASDANDVFINEKLRSLDIPLRPDVVITNPARIVSTGAGNPDLLQIDPYESQTTCLSCPPNLCKGSVVSLFAETHGPFRKTVFFCDGGNDLCLALKLQATDVVCVRKGFKLESLLELVEDDKWPAVKAQLVLWEDAQCLLPFL